MSLRKIKCDGCGNNQFKLLYILKNFNAVKCKKCGLVFRDIILTEQDVKKLYSDDYFPTNKKDVAGQIKDFKNKLSEISKITPHRKLLDIGCSTGIFMKVAKENGWETYGYDISKYAVEICRANGFIVYDELTNLPKFDVITVWNTIDHDENPYEFLRRITNHLNDNGVLILCTSTIDNWLYRPAHYFYKLDMKKAVELCYPVDHSTYFTTEMLAKMLKGDGLTALDCHRTDIGYFNTIFLPLIKKVDLCFNEYSLEKIFFAKKLTKIS